MPGNWTEANTLKFMMYVAFSLGGSPASHFPDIAEKMGPEFTPSALANKWQRLKAEFEKAGGVVASTPRSGKGRPKKAVAAASKRVDASGEDEDEEGTKTPSKAGGRKRKAASEGANGVKKAKVVKEEGTEEGTEEEGEGAVKDEWAD